MSTSIGSGAPTVGADKTIEGLEDLEAITEVDEDTLTQTSDISVSVSEIDGKHKGIMLILPSGVSRSA